MGVKHRLLILFILSLFVVICGLQTTYAQSTPIEPVWKHNLGGYISNMVMTRDGQYVAVFSTDEYDLANTGVSLFDINGQKLWLSQARDITEMEISDDGQYIAAGCNNVDVCLFDHNGNKLWQYPMGNGIYSVAISSDGQNILFLSYRNLSFFYRNGSIKWHDTSENFADADISADGQYVAACSYQNKSVFLYNSNGNKLWQSMLGGHVYSVTISGDGRYIAAGGLDRNVYLFDRSGNKLWQFETAGDIRKVAISPDGRYVAASDMNNNVYLFDRNGTQLWHYETESRLFDIALSEDGRYVSAVGMNNSVFLIGSNGTKLWQYNASDSTYAMAMSGDGQYVAFGCVDKNFYMLKNPAFVASSTVTPSTDPSPQPSIHAFDIAQGSVIKPLWEYKTGGWKSHIALSSDGQYIVVGDQDNKNVYFFDHNGSILWQSKTVMSVMEVAMASDGQSIIVVEKRNLSCFDQQGNIKWQYPTIYHAALSRNGNYVVAANGSSILFFDSNGTLIRDYKSGYGLDWIAISDDGQYIAGFGDDETLHVFDHGGNQLWQYKIGDRVYIYDVAIASDGRYIAVGCNDSLYLFDRSGNKLWQNQLGGDVGYNCVVISPDGQYIAVGARDYNVYYFDGSGNKLWQYRTEGDINGSFAMSADGRYIVVSDSNNNLYILNSSGNKLMQYKTEFAINNFAISDDARYIAAFLSESVENSSIYLFATNSSSTSLANISNSGNSGSLDNYYLLIILTAIAAVMAGGGFVMIKVRGKEAFIVKPAVPKMKMEALPLACVEGEPATATIRATNLSDHVAMVDGISLSKDGSKELFFDIDTMTVGEHSKKVTIKYRNVAGREFSSDAIIKYTVQPAEPVIEAHVDSIDITDNMGIASTTIVNRSDYAAKFGDVIIGKGETHKLNFDLDASTPGSHEKVVKLQYTNRAGRPFEKELTIAYTVHGQETSQQTVMPAVPTPVPDGSGLKDKLVFISYATKDKNIADAVCHSLEQQKIRCWIAPRDVLPGMVFEKAIIKGINDSDIFVIIYSSYSNQSPHVENEVREAWRTGIPIIPFRIEDVPMSEVLRYYISSKHWLDAMTPPLQSHIDDLTRTVLVLLKGAN